MLSILTLLLFPSFVLSFAQGSCPFILPRPVMQVILFSLLRFLGRTLAFLIAELLEKDPVQMRGLLFLVEMLIFSQKKKKERNCWLKAIFVPIAHVNIWGVKARCHYRGVIFPCLWEVRWPNVLLHKHGCYIYLGVPLSVAFELTFGWGMFLHLISGLCFVV